MRSITNETLPRVFMGENAAKPENCKLDPTTESQAKVAELENELKKQKAAAEKGANLMKMIWGDKFQSDSLH